MGSPPDAVSPRSTRTRRRAEQAAARGAAPRRITSGAMAVLWQRDGRITNLGTLPGYPSSEASGINNRAEVVGAVFNIGGAGQFTSHAALWQKGRIIDLGTLPGDTFSAATAINDHSEIVGWSANQQSRHATLWQIGRTTIDLGLLPRVGISSSTANSINARGQVVGVSSGGGVGLAVRWDDTRITELPDTIPGSAEANDVEYGARGQSVGSLLAETWPFPAALAVIWPGPGPNDAQVLPNLPVVAPFFPLSHANAINDRNQVVGDSATEPGGCARRSLATRVIGMLKDGMDGMRNSIKKLWSVLLLLLCLLAQQVLGPSGVYAATQYYVDPSVGSDSNDGASPTAGSGHGPWRTFRKAATSRLSAGDTVNFASGTYIDTGTSGQINMTSSGSAGAPITFRSTVQHGAVITFPSGASNAYKIGLDGLSYVTFDGFEFTQEQIGNSTSYNDKLIWVGPVFESDNIIVENSILQMRRPRSRSPRTASIRSCRTTCSTTATSVSRLSARSGPSS